MLPNSRSLAKDRLSTCRHIIGASSHHLFARRAGLGRERIATSRSGWLYESVRVLTSDRRVHQRGHVGVDTIPGGWRRRRTPALVLRQPQYRCPGFVCTCTSFHSPPLVYPCSRRPELRPKQTPCRFGGPWRRIQARNSKTQVRKKKP